MPNRKEIFVALGKAQMVDGKRRFVPYSPDYLNQKMAQIPLDKELELKMSVAVTSRSKSQLAYHWILMGLISEYSGFQPEEVHDFVLRSRFGTRKIKLGELTMEVRRSIADIAKMPKSDMVELIGFDIRLCQSLDIHIPSMSELGYMVDSQGKIIK